MVLVKHVLVSTYGRDLRKLNVARKKLQHERLVLICDSGDKDLQLIRHNEEERGGEFLHIEVDPYDFSGCLETCYSTLSNMRGKTVRVNISCGPKTLVGAMLFAAFHAGVEVYHCDIVRRTGKEIVIRMPTLLEFELGKRFSEEDWGIIRLLGKERDRSYISKKIGIGNSVLDKALSRLEREGVIETVLVDGRVRVVPTSVGSFYAGIAPR